MSKKNVLVLCGGQSPEHRVSLRSTMNVLAAMDRNKYQVLLVGVALDGQWNLHDDENFLLNSHDPLTVALANPGEPVALRAKGGKGYLTGLEGKLPPTAVDVAFPVMHGAYGEDGAVQGALKMANIPCVGCGVLASSVCMDKDYTKKVLRDAGVPVAKSVTLFAHERDSIDYQAVAAQLGLPLFIKPVNLGSSVGVSKVTEAKDLKKHVETAFGFDHKVLVEAFVEGREIECAILGNERPRASLPGEILPQKGFYTFEAKYVSAADALLRAPAELDAATVKRVQDIALKTYTTLGCSGLSRVDVFLKKDGEILVNEVNTIPGFTNISMYPKLWEVSGVGYSELIDRLLALAMERFEQEKRLSLGL